MNYGTVVQLTPSTGGRRTTYTTDHGKNINAGGHSPFICELLDDAEVIKGLLLRAYTPYTLSIR